MVSGELLEPYKRLDEPSLLRGAIAQFFMYRNVFHDVIYLKEQSQMKNLHKDLSGIKSLTRAGNIEIDYFHSVLDGILHQARVKRNSSKIPLYPGGLPSSIPRLGIMPYSGSLPKISDL